MVGGGYIAVEFASIFNGMGARTTQIYRGPMFLRGFDQGVREHLRDELTKKGIDLRFNANVARIDKRADGTLAATLEDGSVVETDCVSSPPAGAPCWTSWAWRTRPSGSARTASSKWTTNSARPSRPSWPSAT